METVTETRPPLPKVLVTLGTICIVDVTGISDLKILWRTVVATLWDHEYYRGELDIVFYSDPVPGPSKRLSYEDLFTFCQNSAGSLKLFPRRGVQEYRYPQSNVNPPPWYQAPDVVASVFCCFEKTFICTVHLAGAQRVGKILDRIAKELQYRHYYLPDNGICATSEHQPENLPRFGPISAFYGHFREDIKPDGSLKLFVNAFQAKPAERIMKKQPDTDDLNIAGQVLPQTIVTLVARRKQVCTVVLTGIDNPPTIRQRIIEALRFYEYFLTPDVVITQTDCSAEMTYEPLTDIGLFSLCKEQGDKIGSLKLFVEASTLVKANEYESPQCNPLPKIIMSVLDWDNQQPYFDMDMTGLQTFELYQALRREIEAHTGMKLAKIYGPQPDTWFSWEFHRLFDLILEKGASTGSLKLFVILKEHSRQEDTTPLASPTGHHGYPSHTYYPNYGGYPGYYVGYPACGYPVPKTNRPRSWRQWLSGFFYT